MRGYACLLLLFVLVSGTPLVAQREKLPWADREIVEKNWPNAVKTSTGLRYVILQQGKGEERPQSGDVVTVLYTGRLLNGQVFNSFLDPTQPFRPRVGRDQLIPAWDEALMQMKRGEKRLLIVPYELGYGTKGLPPTIPRMATLVFEMQLIDFGKE